MPSTILSKLIPLARPIYICVSCKRIHSILSLCYENLTEITVANLKLPCPGTLHHWKPQKRNEILWRQTTMGTTKRGWESPKILILSRKHFEAKQQKELWKVKGTTQNIDFEWKTHWSQIKLGTIKVKGTTLNVEFWVENTLEPNNTWNHTKWSEPPKMLIFSRKHFGAKQHWELTFRLLVLREYSYLGVYLSAVTIWSLPFVLVSCC